MRPGSTNAAAFIIAMSGSPCRCRAPLARPARSIGAERDAGMTQVKRLTGLPQP
jgi:hypothetical protein